MKEIRPEIKAVIDDLYSNPGSWLMIAGNSSHPTLSNGGRSMGSVREKLRNSLPPDPEYRHAYADEILNLLICTQMRVLREQRGITQDAMATILETTQTAVSRLESVKYSSWNIKTLKKVAKALDLRLRISFEGFGSLWKDVYSLKRHKLERPDIKDDPEFAGP